MSENTNDKLVDIKKYSKEKERSKREKTLYIILMVVFSVVLLLSLYTISPLSKVDEISTAGNTFLTDQAIIDSSGLSSGMSLWNILFKRNDFESQLVSSEPQVESAELQIDSLNDLSITISEIPIVAYLVQDDALYPVLENGEKVDEASSATHGNAPLLLNFDEENLEDFINSYVTLDSTIKQLVSEVRFAPTESNPNRIIFYMNDGNQVYASINTFAERMAYYLSMTEAVGDAKGVYQLEVGAYFTPFDSTEEDVELNSQESNE